MATTADKSYDLSKFQLERILYNNSKNKSVCVLGNFTGVVPAPVTDDDKVDGSNGVDNEDASAKQSERAIVILEKTAFTENDVCTDDAASDDGVTKRIYFTADTRLKQAFINDIYGNFECIPSADINSNNNF